MEKGVIFDKKPDFILNLGNGYSNVHLNVQEIMVENPINLENEKEIKQIKKWVADVLTVKNPVTYENVVDSAIKLEFPNGESEAALRKGIIDKNDPDFIKLNNFAEFIKNSYKKAVKL